jgi:hypothetical protein
MAFTHTKKVDIGSFIKAGIRIWSQTSGSGSDQKDPDPTGSATLQKMVWKKLCSALGLKKQLIGQTSLTLPAHLQWD